MKDLVLVSVIMLALDSLYLRTTKGFYGNIVKAIQNAPLKLRYSAAAAVYVFMVLGLYYFIINEKRNWRQAFLLGLVIYGVFELTTYAIFSEWPMLAVVIDTIWGGILFASTTWSVNKLSSFL